MHSQKHPCVNDAHTCIFMYLQAPCVHTYPHAHAQVTRAMLIHVCVRTSPHTYSHTYCVLTCRNLHTSFLYIQASSTQVCLSTCAHTHSTCAFLHTPTHALAHVCTSTHAHVPVASLTLPAAGRLYLWCPSTGSSSGWLPPRLLGLRRSPFVPACRGLGAPSQALLQAGSSAPSILHTLLFLQNMRLEIPPREACLLSPAGGEPASLAPVCPSGQTIIRPHLCCGLLRMGHISVPLSGGRPDSRLAVEACRRNGWSEGPGDLHPPQPRWMPAGSPVQVAVGGAQRQFTQSQTRPPRPAGPSWLHPVEVLDLRSCLSPYLLSGSPRTSRLPWPPFSPL